MKSIISSLILIVFYSGAYAQFSLSKKYSADTLLAALKEERPDSVKIRLCYLLSLNYALQDDTVRARQYLTKAALLCKPYAYLAAIFPYYEAYVVWNEIEKSERLFLTAERHLEKYTSAEACYLRAKAWRNFGIHQQEKDNNSGFIDAVLKALPYAKQSGDSATTGILYQDVASVLMNQDQYEAAGENYKHAISYFKSSNTAFGDLAYVYVPAAKNIVFAEVEADYPVARKYLDSAFLLISNNPPSITTLDYYYVEGMYNYAAKQYQASIGSLDKGITLSKSISSPYTKQLAIDMQYQKFFSYYDMRDYKNALGVLLEYMERRPVLPVRNRIRVYGDLSNTYAALGNKEIAYDWLRKYASLSDSLNMAQLKEKVNEMVIKFNSAEKEKQIISLQLDKNKALLAAETRSNTILYLSLVVLLLVTALVLIYFFYQASKRSIAQQERVKITEAMLAAQEEERSRIARDLHDGLGSMLSAIKISMGITNERQTDAQNKAALDKTIVDLGGAIKELRNISYNMMPETLLHLGLEAALKDLCHSLESPQLNIQYQLINIQNTIPRQKQVIVYRIIQELFANVIKHAQASHLFLECAQHADVLFITVEDDGKGINNTNDPHAKGMGLKNIVSRVEYLNGTIDVVSHPGTKGASINVQLDVKN